MTTRLSKVGLAIAIGAALLVALQLTAAVGAAAWVFFTVAFPLPHAVPQDWSAFTSSAWRMPSPEPPASATPTEAARELLPFRDRVIAAQVIAERPENQKTGGWPQENAPEAIASGIAGAKLQYIAAVEPVYRLPSAAAPDPWNAVSPSGAFVVTVARHDTNGLEYFSLRQDDQRRWWWTDSPPVPAGRYLDDDLARIRRLAGQRHFATRFVWRAQLLSWWLVRFDDGTVRAWPHDESHWPAVLYLDGQPIQDRLYPASAIFGDVTSKDRSL